MSWNKGTYKNDYIRIQITNNHIHNKGVWIMNVRELGWSCKEIGISNECIQEEAEKEALLIVRNHLDKIANSLT